MNHINKHVFEIITQIFGVHPNMWNNMGCYTIKTVKNDIKFRENVMTKKHPWKVDTFEECDDCREHGIKNNWLLWRRLQSLAKTYHPIVTKVAVSKRKWINTGNSTLITQKNINRCNILTILKSQNYTWQRCTYNIRNSDDNDDNNNNNNYKKNDNYHNIKEYRRKQ